MNKNPSARSTTQETFNFLMVMSNNGFDTHKWKINFSDQQKWFLILCSFCVYLRIRIWTPHYFRKKINMYTSYFNKYCIYFLTEKPKSTVLLWRYVIFGRKNINKGKNLHRLPPTGWHTEPAYNFTNTRNFWILEIFLFFK